MRAPICLAVVAPLLTALPAVETAVPVQTPQTPFGLVGDEAIGEPLAGREFWAGLQCTPNRRIRGSTEEVTPWRMHGGARGPLSAGDGWNFGYEASASWRVHQAQSYDSHDSWFTQAAMAGVGEWSLSPDWTVLGRLGVVFSDGLNGGLTATAEVEGGGAYALANGGHLVMGFSYRGLSGDPYSEATLLPLVECHLPPTDRFDLVLGFPRTSVRWFPTDDSEIGLRWRFLADAEITARQRFGASAAVTATLWHRNLAWAGTEDGRFYVEESGLSLVAELVGEQSMFQAGPLLVFDETWRSGPDRDQAHTVAEIDVGWGFLVGGGISF